jgi:aminopeptidase N
VSYNKGGGILQMLRNFVGDEAFKKSLNLYLTTNKYKSAEAHQLRLAFEEVTGKDLNWFFNQWYFGAGHPVLDIKYSYDDAARLVTVQVNQTQAGDKVFRLPVKIDVWHGSMPMRYDVWVNSKSETFTFASMSKPDFVNFDADKILVAQKTENKTLDEYLAQYKNARNYVDRREAITAALRKQEEVSAAAILTEAMKDPYGPLRAYAVNGLDMSLDQIRNSVESALVEMAQKDKHRPARAAAISKLGAYKETKYASIFKTALNDSSYTVAGSALEALNKIDTATGFSEAKRLSEGSPKGRLESVAKTIISSKDVGAGDKLISDFDALPFGQAKFQALEGVFNFMAATNNTEQFKKAVDALLKLQTQVPEAYREQVNPALNEALREMQKQKNTDGLKEQADYIESKLSKEKGF